MSEPTRKQLREALLRSGYLVESRLATVLRDRGYYVEPNPPVPDPVTAKSRELDIFAMSAVNAGPDDSDFLLPVILVEAENNPVPVLFITAEHQVRFRHYEDLKMSGIPVRVYKEDGSWDSLHDFVGVSKFHHYSEGRVATQFCTFKEKDKKAGEWMALHEERHHDSFVKLSAAVDHQIESHCQAYRAGGREPVNVQIYYPVLVLQGELLEGQALARSARIAQVEHISYRRTVVVSGKERAYQVDVVTERYFPKLLDRIEQETERTSAFMIEHKDEVRAVVESIAARLGDNPTSEMIREHMTLPN